MPWNYANVCLHICFSGMCVCLYTCLHLAYIRLGQKYTYHTTSPGATSQTKTKLKVAQMTTTSIVWGSGRINGKCPLYHSNALSSGTENMIDTMSWWGLEMWGRMQVIHLLRVMWWSKWPLIYTRCCYLAFNADTLVHRFVLETKPQTNCRE